jgi:hypothetical protein
VVIRLPTPERTGALYLRRARRAITAKYGRIMEICLGTRWDEEWIDEAACIVDDLAAAAGLTEATWTRRTDHAFRLFTDGRRRFDPKRWNDYIHKVAARLQARTIAAVVRERR